MLPWRYNYRAFDLLPLDHEYLKSSPFRAFWDKHVLNRFRAFFEKSKKSETFLNKQSLGVNGCNYDNLWHVVKTKILIFMAPNQLRLLCGKPV